MDKNFQICTENQFSKHFFMPISFLKHNIWKILFAKRVSKKQVSMQVPPAIVKRRKHRIRSTRVKLFRRQLK